MCSIAIQSEHLLGHSPPVYSSLLYNSLMVTTPPITTRTVPPRIRPCLSTGSIHLDGLIKSNDDVIKRNKKRVVFADDRGRPLTQVRVMSEPSNVPPLWSSAYVTKLVRGEIVQNYENAIGTTTAAFTQLQNGSNDIIKNGLTDNDKQEWELSFTQPASDYLAFRHKLDKYNVSLENVIIKEHENNLVGTIKVKNLSYDKLVIVRITFNNWLNYHDIKCIYVEQPGMTSQTSVKNLYDTFKFDIKLNNQEFLKNQKDQKIEFCIKFISGGFDYWDNNNTLNYIISKKLNNETEKETVKTEINNENTENKIIDVNKQLLQLVLYRPFEERLGLQYMTWNQQLSTTENDKEKSLPYW